MKFFNERAFLVRSLIGIFAVQFVTVGYQTFLCQRSVLTVKESDRVSLICTNAANSYNETGKLALATILALLVPSSKQESPESSEKEDNSKEG